MAGGTPRSSVTDKLAPAVDGAGTPEESDALGGAVH